MITRDTIERAIIQNRPGEPFVIRTPADEELTDLSALDWQADTAPPTWKEASAWAQTLDSADKKTERLAEIEVLLRNSDQWVVRAYEDGVAVTAARKQYRTQLRTIAASADPASAKLPSLPVYP